MNMTNLLDLLPETKALFVFFFVLLGFYLYKSTCYPEGFPPGPTPWPIVGNLYQFKGKLIPQLFIKYRKKYGDVVGFKLANNNAIMLNSLEVMKEAFVEKSDIFITRANVKKFYINVINSVLKSGPGGVVWNDGPQWKTLRRFTLMSLRDFGVGKATIEQRIQEEANFVCDVFSKTNKKPFDSDHLLMSAVSNIICSVCMGSRFEYSDPKFKDLVDAVCFHISGQSHIRALNFFPLIRYSPTEKWFKKYRENYRFLQAFLKDQIDKHRESFDPNAIRDFVDHFLAKEPNSKEGETFSTDNLEKLILDIMAAGTDTTSTTLRWFILYLIHHPDVQTKCQKELDAVVGSSRQVALADRTSLPYLDATIHEVQRLSTIAPLGLVHAPNQDTTLGGYRIPKGTFVYSNLYSVHHDPKYWKNPEEFNPERFLDSNGKFHLDPAFAAFGLGPRICLGEIMARTELFLFSGTFLQRFSFKAEDESNLPSLETKMALVFYPASYKVIITPR